MPLEKGFISNVQFIAEQLLRRTIHIAPPVTLIEIQHMLATKEDLDIIEQARLRAPSLFGQNGTAMPQSVVINIAGADRKANFKCRLSLPSLPHVDDSFWGHRLITMGVPISQIYGHQHRFAEHANPEHVALLAEWAEARHLAGLRASAAHMAVKDVMEFCTTPGQLAKAWPELIQFTNEKGAGSTFRARNILRKAGPKMKAAIESANAIMTLGALAPIDPSSAPYNSFLAIVEKSGPPVYTPWSKTPIEAW